MKKQWFAAVIMGLALMAACAAPAAAAVAVSFDTNATVWYGFNSSYMVSGFSFTPTQNLSLTALGYWQNNGLGVVAAAPGTLHTVTIFTGNWNGTDYTGTGVEVASAVIAQGAAALGTFAWTSVSPVILAAGTTYTLSAEVSVASAGGLGDSAIPVTLTNLAMASELGYITGSAGQHYAPPTGGALPLDQIAGSTINGMELTAGVFAGNLQYDVASAPEPATMTLLALGLAGMVLRRRRASK